MNKSEPDSFLKLLATANPPVMGSYYAALYLDNWLPPNLNDFIGRHYRAINQAKKQTADYLAVHAMKAGVRRVTNEYRPVRHLRIVFTYLHHRPDRDNLLKVLLDSLKRSRLIVDDSDRWITYPLPELVKAGKLATWIELTDTKIMPGIPIEQDHEYKRLLARLRHQKRKDR